GQCGAGQVCEGNQCVSSCSVDVCSGVDCGDGRTCDPANGNCIADPCLRTNCGDRVCIVACDGTAQCATHSGIDVLATGGGGLACQVGAAGSSSGGLDLALIAFAAALAHRFTRRRLARAALERTRR